MVKLDCLLLSGEYAIESEVIQDELRVLIPRNRAMDDWLRQEVEPAYDALKADPTRAVTLDQVRVTLAVEHKKAKAKA